MSENCVNIPRTMKIFVLNCPYWRANMNSLQTFYVCPRILNESLPLIISLEKMMKAKRSWFSKFSVWCSVNGIDINKSKTFSILRKIRSVFRVIFLFRQDYQPTFFVLVYQFWKINKIQNPRKRGSNRFAALNCLCRSELISVALNRLNSRFF